MNSIILSLSFRIKISKSFLCLHVCCHRMIYNSESSVSRCNVNCIIEYSALLCPGTISRILQYPFIYCFAAKFELIGIVVKQQYVLLYKHSISVHLKLSSKNGSCLACSLCVLQHEREKMLCFATALKKYMQSISLIFSQAALLSGWIQSYKYSSKKPK